MARVKFTFDEYEDREDLEVIFNRNKLYCLLHDIDNLLRELVNSKTYEERYMYTIGKTKDEYGREVDELSTVDPSPDDADTLPEPYMPRQYIINRLREAIEDCENLLW